MPSFESAGTETRSGKWVHLPDLYTLHSWSMHQPIPIKARGPLEEQEPLINYLYNQPSFSLTKIPDSERKRRGQKGQLR